MHAMTCISCSEPISPTARFCGACGTQVVADAKNPELRVLTIQFIDLVGSTTLASESELETYDETISSFHKLASNVVETYKGNILQRYGDGVLCCFGLDNDGEDSALSAIASGLSIAKAMPEQCNGQNVRVGVDTGQVMCRVGQGGALFPQLTGLHVNRAARLQEQAKPGGVVISGETKAFLSRIAKVDEASHSSIELKGINTPVDVIEVTGYRFEEERGSPSDLLERDEELATLLDGEALTYALVGPAGIGKSSLLNALIRDASGDKIISMDARANLQQTALFPVTEALQRELGLTAEMTTDALRDKLEGIGVSVTDEDLMLLAATFGLQSAQPVLLTPERQKARRIALSATILERLAAQRRATVTFDDLHFADSDSAAVLTALTGAINGAARLVVTSRPGDAIDALLASEQVEPMQLRPLSRDAAERALDAYPELNADRRAEIIAGAEGNPLFLSALAQRARQLGSGQEELPLPQTIEATFQAIINGFDDLREVIQCASVLGREFQPNHIRFLMPDRASIDDELHFLTIRGVITPRPDGFAFDHVLMRDAAYEMIPGKRRRALHQQFANQLQEHDPAFCAELPEVLADHVLAARDHENIPAVCMAAGVRMLMGASFDQAMSYLNDARKDMEGCAGDEQVSRPEFLPVLTLLAAATVQRFGFAHPVVLKRYQGLEDAVSYAHGTGRQRMIALYGLFAHRIISGQVRASGELVEQMAALAKGGDDELVVLWLVNETAHALYSGEFDRAARSSAQLKEIYDVEQHGRLFLELGADPLASVLSADVHILVRKGDVDGAIEAMEAARSHLNSIGAITQLPWISVFGAQALMEGGALDKAMEEVQAGIELADEQHADFWSLNGRLWQAIIRVMQGDTTTAPAELEAYAGHMAAIGAGLNAPFYDAVQARALIAQGDMKAARDLLDRADALTHETGEFEWSGRIDAFREMLEMEGESAPPGPGNPELT